MTVELEPCAEPIAGSLDDGTGAPIEFAGWLELMSAFDTARARAAAGATSVHETPRGGPNAMRPASARTSA